MHTSFGLPNGTNDSPEFLHVVRAGSRLQKHRSKHHVFFEAVGESSNS